jgi:pimeloyl-ACP methyl ester carboxylesterase
MLHEGLGSAAMWKDFPQQLANATGARVIAYSRFGYGESEPVAAPYQALEMHEHEALEVLPVVLQELGIGKPVLFGHSDGASIALINAGSAPEPVAAVIALAPHVFVEDICITSIEKARMQFQSTDLPQRLSRYHRDSAEAFWLWNNVWLDPAFRAWNIERHLGAIRCPLLAVQGYDDEYGTMEQLERVSRGAPQTTLLRLSACGHSPHRDQPAAVLQATAALLRQIGDSKA